MRKTGASRGSGGGGAHSIRRMIERAAIDFAAGRSRIFISGASRLTVAPHPCRRYSRPGSTFPRCLRASSVIACAHQLPKVILCVKCAEGLKVSSKPTDHRPARNRRRLTLWAVQFSSLHARPALASFLLVWKPCHSELPGDGYYRQLIVNRRGLTIFAHAMTGDTLKDHTDHVLWLGDSEPIAVSALPTPLRS